MSTKYLLPCPSCQHTSEVDAGQAGDRITCSCGAQVDVPTLRGLRALQPATAPDKAAAKPASNWGLRQGLMLFGSVVLLVGLLPAAYLYIRKVDAPQLDIALTIEQNSKQLDAMPLSDSWNYYEGLSKLGLLEHPRLEVMAYEHYMESFKTRMTAALSVACLGLLVLLAGWLLKPLFGIR